MLQQFLLLPPINFTILLCLGLLVGYVLISRFSTTARDGKDNKIRVVSFPEFLFGWLLSLSLTPTGYLYRLGISSTASIVQVNLHPWGSKCTYLVLSSDYTAVLQNKSKYLSMKPMRNFCTQVGAVGDRATAIIHENMGDRKAENAYNDLLKPLHQSLRPGDEYNRIAATFTLKWSEEVQTLQLAGKSSMDLYEFIQSSFVKAISFAMWGESCPYYLDASLVRDWWTFHGTITAVIYSVLPLKLFCRLREGLCCRQRVVETLAKFYRSIRELNDSVELPSRMIEYMNVAKKWDLTDDDIARLDLSTTLGAFQPPVDASYGLLIQILSRPKLLANIRAELEKVCVRDQAGKIIMFHAHNLRKACPLLLSCFFESARRIGTSFAIREVADDFTLGDYNLRKGNLLILAGVAINHNEDFWPEPYDFKPDRFLGVEAPYAEFTRTYRAFGGGAGICGGRYMAPHLVMTTVATLLLAFDFEPEPSSFFQTARWAIPHVKNANVPEAVAPPRNVGSTRVQIAVRHADEEMYKIICEDCNVPS